MKFSVPVREGRFLKRYKRFFADIEFDGEVITAHVPNTGSMRTCMEPGAPCRFTVHDDPKRKLPYTLQMIKMPKSWIGVNTHTSNQLVWEAWQEQKISHWVKFKGGQKEVKINEKSRIDFVFWKAQKGLGIDEKIKLDLFSEYKFHFVEVKNVTLGEDGVASFPDAVSTRAQKHLTEMMELMEQGHTAELLLTVQRNDCQVFQPAREIDEKYAELLTQAKKKGLKITPFCVKFQKNAIHLNTEEKLPVRLK